MKRHWKSEKTQKRTAGISTVALIIFCLPSVDLLSALDQVNRVEWFTLELVLLVAGLSSCLWVFSSLSRVVVLNSPKSRGQWS